MFIWRASNKDQPQVPKHVQVFTARSAAEKKKTRNKNANLKFLYSNFSAEITRV